MDFREGYASQIQGLHVLGDGSSEEINGERPSSISVLMNFGNGNANPSVTLFDQYGLSNAAEATIRICCSLKAP